MTRKLTDFDLARQGWGRADRRRILRTGRYPGEQLQLGRGALPSRLLMRLLRHAGIIPKLPAGLAALA